MMRSPDALSVTDAASEAPWAQALMGARPLEARMSSWALAFVAALSTSQVAPFTSNQETYWVHALAATANGAVLHGDWLVRALDPVPLFTLLAAPLVAVGCWAMWLVNAALGAVLLVAMAQIASAASERAKVPVLAWVAFFGLIWAAFPGAFRGSCFDGVAEQRAYCEYLQPSNAGVLLIAGVWFALDGRSMAAVLVSAAAAWIHPTYALSAVIFTLGVLVADLRAAQPRALLTALVGLLATAPPAWASACRFAPTSQAVAFRAAQLLTAERMPHHALLSSWGHRPETLLKVALVSLAIASSTGRTRRLLVTWLAAVLLFTGLVVLARRPQFLLLFPWRSSVWLVPVAAALLWGRAARIFPRQSWAWLLACLPALSIACCYRLARGHSSPGPDQDPGVHLAGTIGRSERERWSLLIPVDWEAVRMNAPASVYVDFKSHPYKDSEVLAWWERVARARAVFPKDAELDCRAVDTVLRTDPSVGFVLAPRATGLAHCAALLAARSDDQATLYRIRGRTSMD